jgi:L-cysteine/cystine lyase
VTFDEARARFPILARAAYLNAGTFGPLAQTTIDAVERQQRLDIEAGRAGTPWFEALLAARSRVRAMLAHQVGVRPEQVTLTRSTTDGINIVLGGLRLGEGDEVVTTDVEHFGLIGPLVVSGADVRVTRLRDTPAGEAFDRIRAEITPRTRLLALSAVSWLTGNALPAAELRAETGIATLVDGAQSVGAIPVDARSVDYTTISGQKWLCGPDSTGGLVIREPGELGFSQVSYFAAETYDLEHATFEPKAGAQRFDQGWIPFPALAGLEAALSDLPDWRYERARAQAARLRELLLAAGLDVVTGADQATLVSFRPRDDAAETVRRLAERDVVVRDIPGSGLVRASVGWWTSDEELGRLLDGLRP